MGMIQVQVLVDDDLTGKQIKSEGLFAADQIVSVVTLPRGGCQFTIQTGDCYNTPLTFERFSAMLQLHTYVYEVTIPST